LSATSTGNSVQSVPAISFSSSNSISSVQSAPAAPSTSALLADSRNLNNHEQQGPSKKAKADGIMQGQMQDAQARTKRQLAEGEAEALFHSNHAMKELADCARNSVKS